MGHTGHLFKNTGHIQHFLTILGTPRRNHKLWDVPVYYRVYGIPFLVAHEVQKVSSCWSLVLLYEYSILYKHIFINIIK